MTPIRRHLPLVLSALALFFAVGGGSMAVAAGDKIASLVTGKQVKDASLTGADVRNGSLTVKDFRAGSLPAGPAGPAGAAGAQGPADESTPAPGPGNVIFTLPASYRPSLISVFPVVASNGIGRVTIKHTGEVIYEAGPTGWVSLDGISFTTG